MLNPNQLPELKLLLIFVSVVKNQGFANAQQELNLSTSAISTYMSQLESHVGMKLCARGRGGFGLTHKGGMFYEQVLILLQELDRFSENASQIKGELGGTIKIGMIDSMITEPQFPVDRIIERFAEKNSHVHICLEIHSPYELQMGVLENKFDVAIGSFFNKMSGIIYHPLYKEQHWLFCSDKHSLFSQRQLSIGQITHENMVRRSYWSQHVLAKHGFQSSSATVESMEAQLILILSGKYIGFLPEHYAQYWVEKKRLKVLLPSTFGYHAPFSLIIRRGRVKETFIREFKNAIMYYQKS
jgi:DNA-binding transcriptional LysR family regulator